jgi:hypothetical protein
MTLPWILPAFISSNVWASEPLSVPAGTVMVMVMAEEKVSYLTHLGQFLNRPKLIVSLDPALDSHLQRLLEIQSVACFESYTDTAHQYASSGMRWWETGSGLPMILSS